MSILVVSFMTWQGVRASTRYRRCCMGLLFWQQIFKANSHCVQVCKKSAACLLIRGEVSNWWLYIPNCRVQIHIIAKLSVSEGDLNQQTLRPLQIVSTGATSPHGQACPLCMEAAAPPEVFLSTRNM